jgi:hypothetical protein
MAQTEIHIIQGPSAAACLRQGAGVDPDSLLINYDILSCGPLRPLGSLNDWTRLRQDYLTWLSGDDQTFTFSDQDHDLLSNPEVLQRARRITLWIGTGLAEQLLLLWVIEFLKYLATDLATFRVVQFNRQGNAETVGVGVLNPSQFGQHPDPLTLDDTAFREAGAAWVGVTASEPAALLSFLSAERHSLPLLQRSLVGLLHRYPDSTSGLNAWYELLRYTQDVGPKAIRVIGHTMAHDMDFPDWVGDDYLFQRLRRLGDLMLNRPLVTLAGDTNTMRGTEVQLTQEGVDVLAGKANAVVWNGIDDWVGGVHLDSQTDHVWFHKDGTLVRR